MTIYTIQVSSDGADEYVRSSARMRGLSEVELLRRVMGHVLQSQLILSVMDDADELNPNVTEDELQMSMVVGRRYTLEKRCEKFIELLRARGRLCRQDFGAREEITKWEATIKRLVTRGDIVRLDAEPLTRIVYYVLRDPQSPVVAGAPSVAPSSPSDDAATEDVTQIPAFLALRRSSTY